MQYAVFDMLARSGSSGTAPSGTIEGRDIHCGQVTVSSKGTPVQLTADDTPLEGGVWFFPVETGSKKIYIGTTTQKPTEEGGLVFAAGNNFYVEANNLKHIWVDASDTTTTLSYMAC